MTREPETMGADEFRKILAALDLSQQAAARLLGVSGRTAQVWALGDGEVSAPTAILLRLLAKGKVSQRQVLRIGYEKF